MPVNTSSTGASYGKSSDPLCPLGFHPQVRWPTRCKRCFRDYKEHSDASDRKKYGDLESNTSSHNNWSNSHVRTGFTKSKSLDVSSDIPEWRKRMLLRQEARELQLSGGGEVSHSSSSSQPERNLLRSESDPFKILSRSQSVQPEKVSSSSERLSGVMEPFAKKKSPSPVRKEPEETATWTTENSVNSWMSWKTKTPSQKEDVTSKSTVSTESTAEVVPTATKKEEEPRVKKTPSWKRVDSPALLKSKSDLGFSKKDQTPSSNSSSNSLPSWKKALQEKAKEAPSVTKSPLSTHSSSTPKKVEEEPLLKARDKLMANSDFESHKASKISEELLKAKALIREYEGKVSSFEKDKKSQLIRIRDLEGQLENRPMQSETKKIISELKTKYDYMEKKCQRLEKENDNLLNNVHNLEGELEEVQDNFREDEADEYRHIKRELELASKNCRVLQFKLKKVEKVNHDLEKEKAGLESKMKALSSSGGSSDSSSGRIAMLEKELEEKKAIIKRLESGGKVLSRRPNSNGPPSYSRAGSSEANIEDQLLKDLKDSIERENDLKEQLSMAEEDASSMRRQLSQVEDENEALSGQVKRLSTKAYGGSTGSAGELRLQLEVAERENSSLRRKVEALGAGERELSEAKAALASKDKELTRLRGLSQKNSLLEAENAKLNAQLSSGLSSKEEEGSLRAAAERSAELERRLSTMKEKQESTSREVIAAEREKRRIEEEKHRALSSVSRLEGELRDLKSELRELRSESDLAKRKNRDNLLQTQEGVRVFKEQISVLKSELSEERNKVREVRELHQGKIGALEEELEKLIKSKEESSKKIKDLEEKWAKSKRINNQRKDKIEALEKTIESLKSGGSSSTRKAEKTTTSSSEFLELKAKYDLMEEQLVLAKACLQTEKDDLEREHGASLRELAGLKEELRSMKVSLRDKEDSWARERREFMREKAAISGNSGNSNAAWDIERERFKHIMEDRDSQIIQLRAEAEMGRSQVLALKKEADDLKFKLNDYEKMSKFQKVVSQEASLSEELKASVEALEAQLASEAREHKAEMKSLILSYDTKLDILEEELTSLKASSAKAVRERDSYKSLLEQKGNKVGPPGGLSELSVQMQILEDELSEAKAEASMANAKIISNKSNYEIQLAELSSRINELEESALIESGRARIAGTRTKMELAWQKERDGMKKLINELNTMARDLKSTLLEMEKEKETERLEAKRKIEGMRKAFEGENEDTKKQITDLQYDLLELRDAHAKLRTTNEKLRRDRTKIEKENEHYKIMLKEKTKSEIGEDKKLERLSKDLEDFLKTLPQVLKPSSSSSSSKGGSSSHLDSEIAKTEFNSALQRITDSTRELVQMHARRATETISERKRHEDRRSSSRLRSLAHGDSSSLLSGAGGGLEDLPDSTRGSRESISSSVSIPLPIPVRTRSVLPGGGDPSKDYSIRRLERETSMDRMSTGSRESSFSTQSEWVRGEKSKKKTSLIGKLKKLTKSRSEDPYGSGSDISLGGSALSINSSRSVFTRAQESKGARSTPDANLPYDKYFSSSSGSNTLNTRSRARSQQHH